MQILPGLREVPINFWSTDDLEPARASRRSCVAHMYHVLAKRLNLHLRVNFTMSTVEAVAVQIVDLLSTVDTSAILTHPVCTTSSSRSYLTLTIWSGLP
jgi:hypothetical protein